VAGDTRRLREASGQATLDAFAKLPGLAHETGYYEAPHDYSDWNAHAHARLAAGLPTDREDLDWENGHYVVGGALVVPNTGRAYTEAHNLVAEIAAAHGLPPLPLGFHMHAPRALVVIPWARLSPTTP
jgi:hypothetical protein